MKVIISLMIVFLSVKGSAQYIETANEVGIDHVFNDFGNMGGGAVFFDYDNDGWEDLYITGGFDEDSMYRNKGDGTFEKVLNIGFEITEDFNTIAAVSGDVNNDGFRDLFVTSWYEDSGNLGDYARNLLFINNGNGTFTESGVSWELTEKSFSMGTSMLDYNKDGFLDIYVINYQKTSSVIRDINDNIIGFDHECFEDFFYENNGDGTFTEKAAALGINNNGCGLAVMPTDFDKDYDQDIYVANDFGEFIVPNTMYRNNSPSLTFTDRSNESQTNIGIYAMGISYADIDKDLDFDYYISNLGRNVLLQNDGNQVFSDIATSAGVENTYALEGGGLFSTSWGTAFLDVNNDTWPDLFVANGQIPAAPFIATGESDPNFLFINNGDLTFTGSQVSAKVKNRGRGMAYSDYDKDGDLDIVVVVLKKSTSDDPKTTFFQNQLNPNGSDGKNWIQFDLEGVSINKDAIGAKIILTVNGEKLIQEVHGQGSHTSQHSLILHFGLGSSDVVTEAEIEWTSTSKQSFTNLGVNKRYELKEGGTLSIDDVKNLSIRKEIVVYPNPIQDRLSVSNILETSKYVIYSLEGKKILKGIINSNEHIDVSKLKKGVYLINIFNQKQNYNKKIVKK